MTRHRPVTGLLNSPQLTESRLESILGIESPATKSRRQMRLESIDHGYASEARQEALMHMAAGQRAFELQQKEEMISSARFKQIHNGMTALAQKVYAAVPISEPWSTSYIHSEMLRNGGSTKDFRTVAGCLNSLIEAGLVLEPVRGTFIRSQVKEKPTNTVTAETLKEPMSSTPTAKIEKSPVAILSGIAGRAKAASEVLRKLADDIETAALEIEENNTARDADISKLKQLQQLLKGL